MKRTQSKVSSGKQALITWAKNACKYYPNVTINDLSMSFRDGIAFLGILHHFLGSEVVGEISDLKPNTNERENLDRAFKIAANYNIEQFMSTDDILFGKKPEPLSMETQVIQFYQYFKDKKPFGGSDEPVDFEEEKTIKRVQSFTGEVLYNMTEEERKKNVNLDERNLESVSEGNTPKIKVSIRKPLQRTTSMIEEPKKENSKVEEEMVRKKLAEKQKEEIKKKEEEKKKEEKERLEKEELKRIQEEKQKLEEQKREEELIEKKKQEKKEQERKEKEEQEKKEKEQKLLEEKIKKEERKVQEKVENNQNVEMKDVKKEKVETNNEEELTEEQKKAIEQFNDTQPGDDTQPGCASCIIL